MKKAIAISILTLGLIAGLTSVSADQAGEAEVNVSVDAVTQVDVRPTELSYLGLEPGDQATATDEANNYTAIEVENIGSNRIQEVWAETSQTTTDPFGTGSASKYDAGNFVQLSTETAFNDSVGADYSSKSWQPGIADGTALNFHYVNRIEFVDTPVPTYIDTTTDTDAVDFSPTDLDADVGRFREGDKWYFYTVYHAAGGNTCKEEAELWVGTDPHTPTSLGTTDFTNATANAEVDSYSISPANDNVGVTDSNPVDINSNITYEDVYTYCDPSNKEDGYTARSKFNTDPDLDPSGANITDSSSTTTEIFDAANDGQTLKPGAHFPVDVTVQLPQGVVDEDITGGTLTLLAQSGNPP